MENWRIINQYLAWFNGGMATLGLTEGIRQPSWALFLFCSVISSNAFYWIAKNW